MKHHILMFDPINISVHYNNLVSGNVKDQFLKRKELIWLIDSHPTYDDLEDNFIALLSSDGKSILQAKRFEPNEWQIDIPIKISENDYKSILYSINHANVLDAMLNFFEKDGLFDLINERDSVKISNYMKSQFFVW